MTPRTAKALVITGTAGAAILESVVQLADGKAPSLRLGIGVAIAGALMYALTDIAPPVAGGMGALLLTGAILTNGVRASAIVSKALA